MRCSECEYAQYLKVQQAYTCNHPNCNDVPVFTGNTHPRCCPLTNSKGTYNGCRHAEKPSWHHAFYMCR